MKHGDGLRAFAEKFAPPFSQSKSKGGNIKIDHSNWVGCIRQSFGWPFQQEIVCLFPIKKTY